MRLPSTPPALFSSGSPVPGRSRAPSSSFGYHWERDGEGAARAFVDPEALEARATVHRQDISFMRGREDRLRARIKGYQAAFALCPDTQSALDAVLAELDDAAREGV